jgi:hypothetical protein
MRTRLTIMVIVLAAVVGAVGVTALLIVALGWLGPVIAGVGTIAVLGAGQELALRQAGRPRP